MEPRAYAIDSGPVRFWETMRLSTWIVSLALHSTTDLFDRPTSYRP